MKIALFILPLIIIAVVFGLATQGIVNIPGISPKPKKKVAKKGPDVKIEEKKKDEVVKPKPKEPPPVAKKEPGPDPVKGDKAIAGVWEGIPTEQLVKIAGKWKDPELARVLFRMDTDKVAELLASFDETRASKLSREIQRLAAAPVPAIGA